MSRKIWVVPLVGQWISSCATRVGLAKPDGLLQGIAAEAAAGGDVPVDRQRLIASRDDLDAAPMAARLVFLPTSFTVSQWLPWPGFWKRTLWYLSPLTAPPVSTKRSTSPSRSQSPQATPWPF